MNRLSTVFLGLLVALFALSASAAPRPDIIPIGPDGQPVKGYTRPRRDPRERDADPLILQLLTKYSERQFNSPGERAIAIAKEFIGTPYVAKTLDQTPERETLVVNTKGVDCTTLVEYVVALTLATQDRSDSYVTFLDILHRLRYNNGNVDYPSRNHYFSSWMENNAPYAREITGNASDKRGAFYPYVAKQTLNINYMTTHTSQYPQLKIYPQYVAPIREVEQHLTGTTVRYIPKRLVGQNKKSLGIENGDIIAIVTNKKGLDTSHIGFAVWGDDGKLHLLNASSIHHKVVLESKTLLQYMNEHPSQLGIRILRLNSQ